MLRGFWYLSLCGSLACEPAPPRPHAADAANRSEAKVENGQRLALLVACTYPRLPKHLRLDGPDNDVAWFRSLLTTLYGFAEQDIVVLSDAGNAETAPNRSRIGAEFERLVERAEAGTQIVILLAGHGSRQPDDNGDEPDGWDEIFLASDAAALPDGDRDRSRVPNAIVDDEVHGWVEKIAAKGASVWIIFDCCHSGTGLRGDSGEVVRYVDGGQLGISRPVNEKAGAAVPAASRGAATADAFDLHCPRGEIVAFYAAQPEKPTIERSLPRELPVEQRKRHSIFSYSLCSVLEQHGALGLTYRDLMDLIDIRYNSSDRWRCGPFLEASDADQVVLGGGRGAVRLKVLSKEAHGGWKINGGFVHGLTKGARLAVREGAASGEPIGYVEVSQAGLTESKAVSCEFGGLPAKTDLPIGGFCQLVYIDYGDLRLRLALDRADSNATQADKQRLAGLEPAMQRLSQGAQPLLAMVDFADADWVVQAREGRFELLEKGTAAIADPGDRPRAAPVFVVENNAAEEIERHLTRIFRVQNLLRLAGDPRLNGSHRRDVEPVAGAMQKADLKLEMRRFRGEDDKVGIPVPVTASDTHFKAAEDWMGIRVSNAGRRPVDVTLLFVDSRFNVTPVFPPASFGTDNRLRPGEVFETGPRAITSEPSGLEHLIVIAEHRDGRPQRNYCFLAASSASEARRERRGLGDDAFKSPFEQLLQYAAFNDALAKTRGGGVAYADVSDNQMFSLSWVVDP